MVTTVIVLQTTVWVTSVIGYSNWHI